MNAEERQAVCKNFLVIVFNQIKAHGYFNDDDVFGQFSRVKILSRLTSEEVADIIGLTGMHRDGALNIAKQDHVIWDAVITANNLQSAHILIQFGVDRLMDVIPKPEMWAFLTRKPFWLTSPDDTKAYKEAHACVRQILEVGLHLNIFTRGPLAYAMRHHMTQETKENLGVWVLGFAVGDNMPDLEAFWSFCDPYQIIPLPALWEVVESNIAGPLGLLSPPVFSDPAPAPVSEASPETRMLFPVAQPAAPLPAGPAPVVPVHEEEPLSSRPTAMPGDPAASDPAGQETRREGNIGPKEKRVRG